MGRRPRRRRAVVRLAPFPPRIHLRRSVGDRPVAGPGYYIFFEAGPDRRLGHDRMRSGLNHVAFVAGSRTDVDAIVAEAPAHAWTLMFADRHPFAGGEGHYAAYLENHDGFEVELVAAS